MSKSIGILAGLLLVTLIGCAIHWQHKMERALPEPIMCKSQGAAWLAAASDGNAVAILGTGSMAPVIPPAPAGRDPFTTVVAYVSLVRPAFADIKPGDLMSYKPQWPLPEDIEGANVMHQAVSKDKDGWIMSGLSNAHYESAWRVTAETYVGVAKNIYLWPLDQ